MKTIKYLLGIGKRFATGAKRKLSRHLGAGMIFDRPDRAARFAALRFETPAFVVWAVDRHGNTHGMLNLFA